MKVIVKCPVCRGSGVQETHHYGGYTSCQCRFCKGTRMISATLVSKGPKRSMK